MNNNYWVTFKGTRSEVTRQLGAYWAQQNFLGEVGDLKAEGQFSDLMKMVKVRFPIFFQEIENIVIGYNEKVPKSNQVTIVGVFNEILGEAGCATIGAHSGKNGVLSHNEEWVCDQPLCFAHVTLTDSRPHHKFLSVSYPFQLFGSSCGATSQFAFSGNSIDMDARLNKIVEKTVRSRVPKTVLTRSLLDAKSVKEASKLLRSYHLLQANNLCFLTADGVYTEQFVPSEILDSVTENQVARVHSKNGRFCQTNSILKGEQVVHGTKSGKKDIKRRNSLTEKIKHLKSTPGDFEKFMMTDGRNKKETSATITFELNADGMSGRAVHYFTGSEFRVSPQMV